MNNKLNENTEVKLNLKAIIWGLLTQWKALIAVSVLLALFVTAVNFFSDMRAYKADLAAQIEAEKQAERPVEERVADVLNSVPEDEREEVNYIVREKEWLNAQRDYVNNSVLMQTDPSHQRVLKLIYDIDCEDLSDLPVLIDNYSIFANGSEVVQALKSVIDPSADDVYISELFYEEGQNNSVESEYTSIRINVVLPEETDAASAALAIDNEIKKYASELKTGYPHSISKAGEKVVYLYHRVNVERRTNTINSIYNLENFIKNAESTISAEQRDAIDELLSIKEENGNKEASAANEKESAKTKETLAKPTVGIKHGVLGFILGVFMYAASYVILLIIRGRVSAAANAEEITGVRLLGEIYYDGKHKGLWKAFHSRLVAKYRYRGKLDEVMQINRISESIDAICEHNGTKNLTVLSACSATEVVKNLKEGISAKGIDVAVVEVGEDFDEKSLLAVDNAVLAIGADTKVSKLAQLMSLCSEYDSSILGSVYMSSY